VAIVITFILLKFAQAAGPAVPNVQPCEPIPAAPQNLDVAAPQSKPGFKIKPRTHRSARR
jgi:hypothetical protein